MYAFSFSTAIILMLFGCSNTMLNSYPDWPPVTKISKDSIVSITGKYHAKSEPHQQIKGYSESLLPFFAEDQEIIKNLTSVSIYHVKDQNNHHIKVKGLQGNSVANDFVLKEDEDFKLTDEGIQIFRDWHYVNINFGLAWEKNYYTFSQASDGSLILKNNTFFKGLIFFIIPVYSEELVWWRWISILN